VSGSGKVQWLAVSEQHKGKGYGKLLLCAAMEHIKSEGTSAAHLVSTSRLVLPPCSSFALPPSLFLFWFLCLGHGLSAL
jgi:hypothetical protein